MVGDATTGGGRVITGSPVTDIEGMAVARVGDKATCPKHQRVTTIVSGDITLTFEGQPVARHGDRLSCGCSLIAGKQSRVYLDMGGEGGVADGVSHVAAASDLAPLPVLPQAGKPPVCEACLLAASRSGATFLGR